MPVAFADYLAAKFALDERSLNCEVRGAFLEGLQRLPHIECLDVGAGTGATLRRLLQSGLSTPLSVTLLDRDRDLLEQARAGLAGWLQASAMPPAIRFVAEALNDHRPDRRYNVITAHAFLDIMPLTQALRLFSGWLQPGGYLYASLNYNGETVLADAYENGAFEGQLLDYYNHTMETRPRRRPGHGRGVLRTASHGAPAGIRVSRARLRQLDWHIAPLQGRYRDNDAVCLTALLEMIRSEAQRSDLFRREELDRWHDDRQRRVQEGRLAMHVHQTDVLARFEPKPIYKSRSAHA
jgi:ubiquinone/menaquinone biosynthesis C-methylase UbiE